MGAGTDTLVARAAAGAPRQRHLGLEHAVDRKVLRVRSITYATWLSDRIALSVTLVTSLMQHAVDRKVLRGNDWTT